MVPFPSSDVISILCPNFSHKFLTIKRPIPVEFAEPLPLYPVNVLSNTLGKSFSLIPIPLSMMYNLIILFSSRTETFIKDFLDLS